MAWGNAAGMYWEALGRLVADADIHARVQDAAGRIWVVDEKTVPDHLRSEHRQIVAALNDAVGRDAGKSGRPINLGSLASRIYSMTYRLATDADEQE